MIPRPQAVMPLTLPVGTHPAGTTQPVGQTVSQYSWIRDLVTGVHPIAPSLPCASVLLSVRGDQPAVTSPNSDWKQHPGLEVSFGLKTLLKVLRIINTSFQATAEAHSEEKSWKKSHSPTSIWITSGLSRGKRTDNIRDGWWCCHHSSVLYQIEKSSIQSQTNRQTDSRTTERRRGKQNSCRSSLYSIMQRENRLKCS